MSLFGVKIHKTVNFSKLDSSKMLKMHKSSASSAICTTMHEFQCWGTPKVLHYDQLKFNFFNNFVQFLSKTAAEVSLLLAMVALRKNYTTNVTSCGLHDDAICFGLLSPGETSTCLRNTTPVYRYCH